MGQNLGPQEDEQSKRRRRQTIFSWEEDLGTISTDESSGYCAKSWDWAEWCLIRHLWNLWGTCWNDVFLYGISSWMMFFCMGLVAGWCVFLMNGEKGDELGTSQLGICSVMWGSRDGSGEVWRTWRNSQPHKWCEKAGEIIQDPKAVYSFDVVSDGSSFLEIAWTKNSDVGGICTNIKLYPGVYSDIRWQSTICGSYVDHGFPIFPISYFPKGNHIRSKPKATKPCEDHDYGSWSWDWPQIKEVSVSWTPVGTQMKLMKLIDDLIPQFI